MDTQCSLPPGLHAAKSQPCWAALLCVWYYLIITHFINTVFLINCENNNVQHKSSTLKKKKRKCFGNKKINPHEIKAKHFIEALDQFCYLSYCPISRSATLVYKRRQKINIKTLPSICWLTSKKKIMSCAPADLSACRVYSEVKHLRNHTRSRRSSAFLQQSREGGKKSQSNTHLKRIKCIGLVAQLSRTISLSLDIV